MPVINNLGSLAITELFQSIVKAPSLLFKHVEPELLHRVGQKLIVTKISSSSWKYLKLFLGRSLFAAFLPK